MTIISTKQEDRKLTNKCDKCKCILPKENPHHWLCSKCWEKTQMEKGRMGYVDWSDRKKMLQRGKLV